MAMTSTERVRRFRERQRMARQDPAGEAAARLREVPRPRAAPADPKPGPVSRPQAPPSVDVSALAKRCGEHVVIAGLRVLQVVDRIVAGTDDVETIAKATRALAPLMPLYMSLRQQADIGYTAAERAEDYGVSGD